MHRETFIAKLADIQQNVEQLLAELQASEHDAFASHLYRSRQEYRLVRQRAGKGGKPVERCVISWHYVSGTFPRFTCFKTLFTTDAGGMLSLLDLLTSVLQQQSLYNKTPPGTKVYRGASKQSWRY